MPIQANADGLPRKEQRELDFPLISTERIGNDVMLSKERRSVRAL